jgi:ATP-dependent exoDNAse (exonuclease V) alpha subunit
VIRPWKKKLDPYIATKTALKAFLIPLVTSPDYDFDNTVILCPFNKQFGTIDLNLGIADALGKQRGAEVWEVIARYQKSYWAVGDRVLVDRREAIITEIRPTAGYDGVIPKSPSTEMDRWGRMTNKVKHHNSDDDEVKAAAVKDVDALMDALVVGGDGEETKNLASHTITVQFTDTGIEQDLGTAGEINAMQFSYVLTVHKSQGSEWKRVYLLLHYSHNNMISRELLYTAVTRARHELVVICEPDRGTGGKHIPNTITRGAMNPEIKGVTLQEKAAYFQAKKRNMAS